ncbi:uncharacterized protein F4807DRAFT_459323 [Annulohypoxylon truncatum]|uniref:uncharacterized protein n=1 Tax=Annulohypoxylon truncatum TaxID=327061 RepID=UPI00200846DD|nr:uncharacterized protein F4807DRAFT_459323 [Annulohypoxylon truncatum]KAI1211092.1 hypothetical protein F4807DRAFT_459323 [Annulohypoxylon truncatum]
MCLLPGLGFLMRMLHRRRKQSPNDRSTIPLEPIPRLDDLDSLENGFLYTAKRDLEEHKGRHIRDQIKFHTQHWLDHPSS